MTPPIPICTRRFRRLPTVLALAVALAGGVEAAQRPLPPITGELGGDFTPLLLPGAPPVHWKLTLRADESGAQRVAAVRIDGPGLQLAAEARLVALDSGTWHVSDATIDVAPWWPVLARRFAADLARASVAGALALSGDGTWVDGRIGGRVALALSDAVIRDPALEVVLTGVALRGTLGALPKLTSDGPLTLTIKEASFAGMVARDVAVEFSIDADERLEVSRATARMFDGSVEVTPFGFPLARPEVRTDVHFRAIEIGQLARVLPPVLAAASGKVSGRMSLAWSAADGVVPGSGRLQIDPGGAAALRLAPQPGFFTSRVPKRIAILPESFGALSRWLSIANPAYEPLRAIEMGQTPLHINSLDIGLRPEGDPEGRTARVVLSARPEADKVIKSVRFEVNVTGPLADVLRLGLGHSVEVKSR